MKRFARSSHRSLGDDAPQQLRRAAERRAQIEQCAARLAAGGEPTTDELRLLAAERARLAGCAKAGMRRSDRRWQARVEEVERQAVFIQRPLPVGALDGLLEEVLARAQGAAALRSATADGTDSSATRVSLRGERREALSQAFLAAPRALGLWRAAAAAAVLFALGVFAWRDGRSPEAAMREDARPLLLQPFADSVPDAMSAGRSANSPAVRRASSLPDAGRGWSGLRVFPLRSHDPLRNDAAALDAAGALPAPDVRGGDVGLERN